MSDLSSFYSPFKPKSALASLSETAVHGKRVPLNSYSASYRRLPPKPPEPKPNVQVLLTLNRPRGCF